MKGLVLVPLFLACVTSLPGLRIAYHPALIQGSTENPGIKLRLTKNVLNQLNAQAVRILGEEMNKFKIDKLEHTVPNNGGKLIFSNVRVTAFDIGSSEVEFEEPNSVIWKIRNIQMTINNKLGGVYVLILAVPLSGVSDTTVSGLNITFHTGLNSTPKGKVNITLGECQTSMDKLTIFVRNGGFAGDLINGAEQPRASSTVKPIMERIVCEVLHDFLSTDVNGRLQKLPFKVPLMDSHKMNLAESRFEGKKENSSIFSDIQFSENLYIDYHLNGQPSVTADFLETEHKGEISWMGEGNTPFGPGSMLDEHFPTPHLEDKSFFVYVSDYLINSMLFHAQQHRMLRLTMSPDTPKFRPFMKTSCFDSNSILDFCVGDLIDGLWEAYPDLPTRMVVQPTRAPAVLFLRKNQGTVVIDIQGVIDLFVILDSGTLRHVLTMDAHVNAILKVWLKDERLRGNVTLPKFKFRLRRSSLSGFLPSSVQKIEELGGEIMETIANGIMERGVKIPTIDGFKMVDPEIAFFSRTMKVGTDFDFDENMLRELIRNAVRDRAAQVD